MHVASTVMSLPPSLFRNNALNTLTRVLAAYTHTHTHTHTQNSLPAMQACFYRVAGLTWLDPCPEPCLIQAVYRGSLHTGSIFTYTFPDSSNLYLTHSQDPLRTLNPSTSCTLTHPVCHILVQVSADVWTYILGLSQSLDLGTCKSFILVWHAWYILSWVTVIYTNITLFKQFVWSEQIGSVF